MVIYNPVRFTDLPSADRTVAIAHSYKAEGTDQLALFVHFTHFVAFEKLFRLGFASEHCVEVAHAAHLRLEQHVVR